MSEQRIGAWIEDEDGSKQFGKHIRPLDKHAVWVEPPPELCELIVQEIQNEAEGDETAS